MVDVPIPLTTEASGLPGEWHGSQTDVMIVKFQKPKHPGCPLTVSQILSLSFWPRTTLPVMFYFIPYSSICIPSGPYVFHFILFYATRDTYYQHELVNWRGDSSECPFSNWARTCQVSNIYSEHSASKLLWRLEGFGKNKTSKNECHPLGVKH